MRQTSEGWFSDYYDALVELSFRLLSVADDTESRARTIGALAYSAFNSDSVLERQLGVLGHELFPWVRRLSEEKNPSRREAAISLARQMGVQARAKASSYQLSGRDVATLKNLIRRGLEDEDIVVRRTSVKAAVEWKLVEALPILERLERADPDSSPSYSVRSLAREARKQLARPR